LLDLPTLDPRDVVADGGVHLNPDFSGRLRCTALWHHRHHHACNECHGSDASRDSSVHHPISVREWGWGDGHE
jgi:hypothetical protein